MFDRNGLLTIAEICALFNLKAATVRSWIFRNMLTVPVRIGRKRIPLVYKKEVSDLLEKKKR